MAAILEIENSGAPHFTASEINYILVSPGCDVSECSIFDPDINFSDHLPHYMLL